MIVLDEVISSLDFTTESIIYRIIDDEFTEKGYTIIIVAHRLGILKEHTNIRRDVVVLLADGRLSEVIEDVKAATFQRLGRMG